MMFWRYNRDYPFVATEICKADVQASNGQELIEVEIKNCWTDFMWDFQLKTKHLEFAENPKAEQGHPNKMYFAAAAPLAHRIMVHLQSAGLPLFPDEEIPRSACNYGVISVSTEPLTQWERSSGCRILKEAENLHCQSVAKNHLTLMASRAASEIIILRQTHDLAKYQGKS